MDRTLANAERILYEGWCSKRSQWLGQWRRRWLVLTPARLLFFSAMRSDLRKQRPTETFEVKTMRGSRLLEALEVSSASGSTPLSCFLEAEKPFSDEIVQVRLEDSTRSVLIDASPEDMTPANRLMAARELSTAIVNAFCAARADLPLYLCPGVMHAFEPRGLVTLRDRYSIGKEIGHGSFGKVYRGRCLQSGRTVAIKRVSLLRVREQVQEEVAILREVRCPHVVSLLNYVEDAFSYGCLVMELLPGGDLYTQVLERYYDQQRPGVDGYSERDVRDILRMALSGLAAIHDHNVVHRDLKPEVGPATEASILQRASLAAALP